MTAWSEAFQDLHQLQLASPEDTCRMLLYALELYAADRRQGEALLGQLYGPRQIPPAQSRKLRERMQSRDQEFSRGAVRRIRLLADPEPQQEADGYRRVFLAAEGEALPCPVRLRQNGDCWYLWDISDLLEHPFPADSAGTAGPPKGE